MNVPKTVKCEVCQTDAEVWGCFRAADQRGDGLLGFIECPTCGKREQWIVEPGDSDSSLDVI